MFSLKSLEEHRCLPGIVPRVLVLTKGQCAHDTQLAQGCKRAFSFRVKLSYLVGEKARQWGAPGCQGHWYLSLSREAAQALQWVMLQSHTVPSAGLGAAPGESSA